MNQTLLNCQKCGQRFIGQQPDHGLSFGRCPDCTPAPEPEPAQPEIITRAEAKARGLKFYFTGQPCSRGGLAERLVSGNKCQCEACKVLALETARRYREENRDKVMECKRRHYGINRDKVLESNRRYWGENRDKVAEQRRCYREESRDKVLDRERRWYKENRDKKMKSVRRYHEKNPHFKLARVAKRRAAKRERLPAWFGELDQFVMQEAAALAAERTEQTGIEWHVDHMIPMQGRKCSGLHCADNIQVIPARLNLAKNNKMIFTEPQQWLLAV